ncbi:MAG: hypothetical protein AAFQ91_28550 [Cyanobacteria bacterium J06621_15]
MDIDQQIWNAEQYASGIPAIQPKGNKNKAVGYVVLEEQGDNVEYTIFPEIKIPDSKIKTLRVLSLERL